MLNCDMLGQRAVSDGEVQRTVHGRVHEPLSLREEAASEPSSGSEATQPSA